MNETEEAAIRYRVRHVTECRYTDDILLAQHLLHVKPRDLDRQRLIACRTAVEPLPTAIADHFDYFGNPATYVAIEAPHRGLAVVTEFEIVVHPPALPEPSATPPWEEIRDELIAAGNPAAIEAVRFSLPTRHVPILSELGAYAAMSFTPGRPIAEAAVELGERIHDEFQFDPVATTISTPIADVLAAKRGVCQDFAHLAIGCLRALGLAGRYVSGYLRTVPPPGSPRLQGADASHAWLSVWCGGETWLDLDPTNGRIGSADIVTLAWGRDYSDVSPMRGVIIGGGNQTVAVKVDVEPLPAPDGSEAAAVVESPG